MPEHTVDYQLAFEALPGSFLLLAPDLPHYTILGVSEEMLRLSGRRRQDVVGKGVFEVFPENPAAPSATGPASLRSSLQEAIATRQPNQMPLVRYDIPDGQGNFAVRYWSAANKPVLSPSGEVRYLLHSTADVTEAVVTRQQMQESEERFRTMADNISQLVWMADGAGWIFWYNRRWYEYTGTTLEEMQGWGWEKVHHPDHIERVMATVKPAWQQNEPWELEFPLRRQDGQYGWFLTRAVPVRDAEGNIVYWFGTNTDITGQQLAQQQLQALNEELAAANEELRAANEEQAAANAQLSRLNADLDTFVYTASHDLKAPILNIEGLLRALEKQITVQSRQNPVIGQLYELLYKSVDRFKTTIGDLTEVARISKESQEDVSAIPPAEVLREVLSDLEPQVREARAQIEVKLECQAVHFSRKNLKSVLYNLLSNALKYRAPGRRLLVKITWQQGEDYQLLAVEDNGLGMDMRQEEKIFALFKRLHNHVEGTGIGLYIVKKMVENAGGRIGVESQVGVGSTFRVYFKQ